LAKKGTGKLFEEEVQTSCKEQKIWFFRVKDVNPMALKPSFKVPENPYDALLYRGGYLFPSEMKSTKGKSLPFKNIKEHQINSLVDSQTYDSKIIPGFIINFSDESRSFFLHIDNFMNYVNFAKSGMKKVEECKVNESSISLEYCEGFATEIVGVKKVKKFRWYIHKLIDELIQKFGE
jgi:penicillin-binding protein-related factor A (putative recombinase)